MKKFFVLSCLILVIIFVGGCKNNTNNSKSNEEEKANLALVLDFYESSVDLDVQVIVWGNYYYRVTDQDLLFDKCKDLDVLMVANNECTLAVLKNATMKYIKDNNIDTISKLQSDFNNMSGAYQKALRENGAELTSYSVDVVEYSQESAELVKEKEKEKLIARNQ